MGDRRTVGWLRGLAVIGLCGLLVGCATGPAIYLGKNPARDAAYDAEGGQGVLIIGFPELGFFSGTRAVHHMDLYSYDPALRKLIPLEQGGLEIRLARGTMWDDEDNINGVHYVLQLVPAGEYYLAVVLWGEYGISAIGGGSIGFTVRPDKATYIGSYDFDTPLFVFQDVKLVRLIRSDEHAARVLARYPKLDGEIEHQEPALFKLECDLSDGLEACYREPPS